MLAVQNPYLESQDDYWYHLGLAPNDEVKVMFHDVKFVCLGGKDKRMENFAKYLYQELGQPKNSIIDKETQELKNIASSAGRYVMYKIGNCISASHGMGMPSFSILLHELFKILSFAGCSDVSFIRLGTCGGLGLDPGTTVVTKQPFSSLLQPFYTQVSCGKEIKYSSDCDESLSQKILDCGRRLNKKIVIGNTMSCEGFYEEQGRLDGALCSFTPKQKQEFLEKAHYECQIKNIEMEANMFGAMCNRYGVKCATVCVAILDRLKGDVVDQSNTKNHQLWEFIPQEVVAELIKSSSSQKNPNL